MNAHNKIQEQEIKLNVGIKILETSWSCETSL